MIQLIKGQGHFLWALRDLSKAFETWGEFVIVSTFCLFLAQNIVQFILCFMIVK